MSSSASPSAPESDQAPPALGDPDLVDIALSDIEEMPNVRPEYYGIDALADSLSSQGQLEPCLVRPAPSGAPHGCRYEMIYGFRRKRAAEQLGWNTLRCEVREVPDERMLDVMISENTQREGLSPVAEAKAMRMMIDVGGISQAECARRLGVSPSHVSHRLQLLELAPPVIEAIDEGTISASHGEVLAQLEPDEQQRLTNRISRDTVPVARVADWVRQIKEEDAEPDQDPEPLAELDWPEPTPLPVATLKADLSPGDISRLSVMALLRSGMDQEMLEYLAETEGVDWDGLWRWVGPLTDEEAAEFHERLLRRYYAAAHRFPTLDISFMATMCEASPALEMDDDWVVGEEFTSDDFDDDRDD